MADIHMLPLRLHRDGIDRLARDLERTLSSGALLSPHGAQIGVTALGLQRMCDELHRAAEQMMFEFPPSPEVETLSVSLRELANAFSKLVTVAEKLNNAA